MNRCGLWMIGSLLAAGLLPGCALPFRHAKLCKSHAHDVAGPAHAIPMTDKTHSPVIDPKDPPSAESEPQSEPPILGLPIAPPQDTSADLEPWTRLFQSAEDPDSIPQGPPPGAITTTSQLIPVRKDILPDVLQCMLDKHYHEALKLLKKYDQATQDFFLGILPVIARVSEKPLESMNAEEVAVVQETMERILETLRPRAVLVVNKMCCCESVKAFGVYKPCPDGHVFQAGCPARSGDLVQVYVELRNICSECREHYHETLLSSDVEISDPRDPKGRALWKHHFDDSKQPLRSRALLHDYYNNYSFYVPHIPPGTYQLTIQVTDETHRDAPRVARKSVEFKVGASCRTTGP